MKVWYQSFTDWEHHSAYLERLQALLGECASPGTTVTVGGLRPADLAVHPVSELRCSVQTLENYCVAAENGYDAVIVGHFQDPQLDAARAMLDIPVVGLGEASMLYGMQLGRRFGLITIHPTYLEWHREQAVRIGLGQRLVGVEALSVTPETAVAACADPDAYAGLREVFVDQARKLVAAGAEVILSAGGLFAVLSAHERRFRVDGAVVLNPVPVALRMAETAAWLQSRDETEPSRIGIYAKPPERAIAELRGLATGQLVA
jgi:allantoin racemase